MRDEYLLVDGYNIVFAWELLRDIASHSLEDARVKLIDILADYQGLKQIRLILVFDAHKVQGGLGEIQQRGGLTVIYTKAAETADNYIERAAHQIARLHKVTVATSDGLEQIIILSKGAIRMSAADLWHEIQTTRAEARQKYIENRPIKRNMLMDNVDEDTRLLLESMRRQKDG